MLLDRMIIWEFVQRHEGGLLMKGTTLRTWAGRYLDLLRDIAPKVAWDIYSRLLTSICNTVTRNRVIKCY